MTPAPDYDVIIAGAGPVGLLLGNLLGREGIRTLLVDKKPSAPRRSMAIGITPPTLEILARIGLAQTVVEAAVKIDHACIFEEKRLLGELRFNLLEGNYPFIVSLPQAETVAILEKNLNRFDSVTIRRQCRFLNATQGMNDIDVVLGADAYRSRTLTTRILVGCDGHRSDVRRSAAIPCIDTKTYPEHFVMADFFDRTGFGNKAHLYFNRCGSLESFPLPHNVRRWILQREGSDKISDIQILIEGIKHRSGLCLLPTDCGELNNFGVQRFVCRRYYSGRVILCGDAAHVMSPIGGQGMNTGIADAELLGNILIRHLRHAQDLEPLLQFYDRSRRRAFMVAANRAERGMWLGTRRGAAAAFLRGLFIRMLLDTPLKRKLPPYFAMRTIPNRRLSDIDRGDMSSTRIWS